jgi:spermidine synthase
VVEIDPEVSRIAYRYLGIPKDTRIKTYNEDARWFVMNHKKDVQYDCIFLDAYNDLSIPYHLTTREFIAQLKPLLKPDGIILANLIDDVETGLLLPAFIKTLEAVFGRGHANLIVPMSSGGIGITTCIVAAGSQKLDMDDFIEKISKTKGDRMVSCLLPQDMLQQDLSKRGAVILTDDYVPVDNLVAPIFAERFGYRRN